MTTSMPFWTAARKCGMPYGEFLRIAEIVQSGDRETILDIAQESPAMARAVSEAIRADETEQERRRCAAKAS